MFDFSEDDVKRFAQSVGAVAKHKGNELVFLHCPYCKGGTSAKRDKNTFSINTKTGQFECKRSSCMAKGNLISLAHDFADVFQLNDDFSRYYNINNFNGKFRTFKEAHKKDSDDVAIEYMKSRGISEEVTRRYGICVSEGEYKGRLVFPFYNEKGELKFIKYRKLDEKDQGAKEYPMRDCMPILFGMDHCDVNRSKTLILTEGQIDSLSIIEAGLPNAVSVPLGKKGFTWVAHCWDFLGQFEELVIFGDNENGKITLVEEMKTRFPRVIKVIRPEDYKGCKDANEILLHYGKQTIVDAVMNAQIIPSAELVDISEVEIIDKSKMGCIKTGFPSIDVSLEGGLYVGQLVIMSGKCGDGKSTFVSQLVANALEQEVKTLIYSGELTTSNVKQWLYQQIANTKSLNNPTINKINAWLKGKLYLYDSNAMLDELQDIPKTLETALKQYGIKLIVVDNLMSAMECRASEDLYQAQSNFVGKLAKLAKTYDAVIILVAHPRKGGGGDNEYIAGSADITNKADLIMRYDRIRNQDEEPTENGAVRVLKITKNRLSGNLVEDNSLGLFFNPESKRITDRHDKEFKFLYKPFSTNNGFVSIDDEEEVPF